MELDDLKQQWALEDAKLDRLILLNERNARSAALHGAAARLRRLSLGLWIELVIDFALLLVLGSFLADHFWQIGYMIPALVLHLSVIFMMVPGIRQLVVLSQLDYDGSVVAIQKKLGSIRRDRLRAIWYPIILSPLLWIPLLIVALKGLLNLNAYAIVPPLWLASNVLFGIVVIAAAVWLSRRYAGRLEGNSFARNFMLGLAGHNLNEATEIVKSLECFQNEPTV